MIGQMITNPAASQKEPESADTQEFMRMINDARDNGLSQASGAGFAQIQLIDADDQSNPDQALLDNPHVNAADQMGMAAFDLAVRGAISAKFSVQIQNKQFHDEFSMTGGDGSLKKYFEQMFDEVDENGKKKDDEWGDFVEAHEWVREQRERMEEEWDRTRHNIAGMQMTGAEIDSLSDFMSDPVNRQKIIERRAREKGISVEQAEKEFDATERYIELYKMRESGEPMTQQQQQDLKVLESDIETRENFQAYDAIKRSGFQEPSATAQVTQSASQVKSVSSGANSLDAQPFSSAPSARTAFAEANAAKEPLDAKPADATPVLSAANTSPSPQVSTSGFDV